MTNSNWIPDPGGMLPADPGLGAPELTPQGGPMHELEELALAELEELGSPPGLEAPELWAEPFEAPLPPEPEMPMPEEPPMPDIEGAVMGGSPLGFGFDLGAEEWLVPELPVEMSLGADIPPMIEAAPLPAAPGLPGLPDPVAVLSAPPELMGLGPLPTHLETAPIAVESNQGGPRQYRVTMTLEVPERDV